MSSRCLCARLEALLMGLPLFMVAPAGAKWLMLQLVKRMAAPEAGGAIPFSDAPRLSLLVSVSVSEVETYLANLLETGLLVRDAAGALSCPALEGLLARTSRAAENGRKGGRPRKGETPEEAMRRRQGHLLLPVEGKPTKPKPESSRASDSIKEVSIQSDAREVYALTEELASIAGMDPARGGYNGSLIRMWLARGATPDLLREVVTRVRGRSQATIGNFAYFTKAVEEALAEPRPSPAASTSDTPEGQAYLRALDRWLENGHDAGRFPTLAEWRARQAVAA